MPVIELPGGISPLKLIFTLSTGAEFFTVSISIKTPNKRTAEPIIEEKPSI